MANNTIKTRIQLKNDTEAHWDLATNFVPREGEAIIYSTDGTHPFSRLKIGDCSTTVSNLPFIAAAQADNATTVNNFTVGTNVPSNAQFTDTTVELIDISNIALANGGA